MKNIGVSLILSIKLKEKVDLENEFNRLQTSNAINCIKYKNNHKCNLEKKMKSHDTIFMNSKAELINIKFNFEDQLILIRYLPEEVFIDYRCLKKNIKMDEKVKFVVDELQLKDHENPERRSYSESWQLNPSYYNCADINQKIINYCTTKNLNYRAIYQVEGSYKINIGSSIIRIRGRLITITCKKNIARLLDFKNFIKEVYGQDLDIKSPFKTVKNKKEISDEDIKIEITI